MKRAKIIFICMALATLICPALYRAGVTGRASAAVQGDPIQLVQVLAGLTSPLYMTSARDASNRLFIVEQPGRIKVLQPGADAPTVFLNITNRVLSGGERGLLGLAFHPQFANNRRFFINYTRQGDGATVIAEYAVSALDPNVAEANEIVLLTIQQPFANHNGGMIEFGLDGFLYIGMGDGGSANDPGNRAQNINDLLGKMLRIDVDTPNGPVPYSSPPTNPFFGATAGRDEIFAVGLRNPFRFSFDRVTGQLYAGDVGQGQREEVDIITLGGNFGWRVFEGTGCTNLGPASCNTPGFIPPITEYDHSFGRCSITGGYVYRSANATLPQGAYIFGDFCTGEIFMFNGGFQSILFDTNLSISSFGEDEAGEIYVVGLGGTIHRIALVNQPPPPPPSPALKLDSVTIMHRSTGLALQPVTARSNGKKHDVILRGEGFASGAMVFIDGRIMKKNRAGAIPGEELVAKLRRDTISAPGPIVVEAVNPDGTRSNTIVVQILAAN